MRKLCLAFVLICLIGFTGTVNAQENNKTDRHEMVVKYGKDTLSFTVYGMDCPGCAGGLEKQVNKISSVMSSEAFWTRQKLTVIMKKDSILNIDELKTRVKKANFTLDLDKKRKEE